MDQTNAIPAEQIIGMIDRIKLPFEKLWIENLPIAKNPIAAIVQANKDGNGFTYQLFQDTGYKLESCFVAAHPIKPRVSSDGIDLDEEVLIKTMERQQTILDDDRKTLSQEDPDFPQHDNTAFLIDYYYAAGEFLSRAFTVLAAQPQAHNVLAPPSAAQKKAEQQNRIHIQMGRTPTLFFNEITIDPTRLDTRFKAASPVKTLRQLLGWTDVRESRPIVSKYGKIYTRKAHDRRIEKEEDRRGMNLRVLKAGDTTMSLDVSTPELPKLKPASNPTSNPANN